MLITSARIASPPDAPCAQVNVVGLPQEHAAGRIQIVPASNAPHESDAYRIDLCEQWIHNAPSPPKPAPAEPVAMSHQPKPPAEVISMPTQTGTVIDLIA